MTIPKNSLLKRFATTILLVLINVFGLLAQKIANQEIWNPTLSELIAYLSKFEQVVLDLDENNNIYVRKTPKSICNSNSNKTLLH